MHYYVIASTLLNGRYIGNDARVLMLNHGLIHDIQRLPLTWGECEDGASERAIRRLLIRKEVIGGSSEASETTEGVSNIHLALPVLLVILKDVLFVSVQCTHLVLQILLLLQHLKWCAYILNDNLGSACLGLRVDALVVGLINAPFLHLGLK
jgi:hypothetical protein